MGSLRGVLDPSIPQWGLGFAVTPAVPHTWGLCFEMLAKKRGNEGEEGEKEEQGKKKGKRVMSHSLQQKKVQGSPSSCFAQSHFS